MTRYYLLIFYFVAVLPVFPVAFAGEQPQKPGIHTERLSQIDNNQVRTWRTIIAANQPLTLHRHDYPRVVTVLRGGILKSVSESGDVLAVRHWSPGESYWLDADPPNKLHACVNDGPEVIEVVVTELK